MTRITINLNVLSLDRRFGFDSYVDRLMAIEAAGIDGIVMPDHVVFGSNVRYPWGGWSIDPADSWPEPIAVLSTAAGATRRVALITNVLIAPLRPAPLLAKQVATLFGLSRGRLQLGVGAGWQREEYVASGVDFETRSELMFDQLRACRALWTQRPASFSSTHVNLADVWCSPGLPQTGDQLSLPLWFGVAPTAANARLFVEFPGAGWSCIDPDPEVVAAGKSRLETLLRDRYGLDVDLSVRAAPQLAFDAHGTLDVEATIANLPACVRAGVTQFDFPLLFLEPGAAAFGKFIERLGTLERETAGYH
jgi:alkanesulfonate monooxygenase SsuD/methylene tetrahydromethanopterin reductase-like flavin-dependent oxidoreductase (luciferase family)